MLTSGFHETIGLTMDRDAGKIYISDLLGTIWETDMDGRHKRAIVRDAGNFYGDNVPGGGGEGVSGGEATRSAIYSVAATVEATWRLVRMTSSLAAPVAAAADPSLRGGWWRRAIAPRLRAAPP